MRVKSLVACAEASAHDLSNSQRQGGEECAQGLVLPTLDLTKVLESPPQTQEPVYGSSNQHNTPPTSQCS